MKRPEPSRLAWLMHGLFLLFSFSPPGLAGENPCAGKSWLAAPIVSRAAGEDSGIGGTGYSPQPESVAAAAGGGDGEEGIGGTGIVGVIAGFASICVNGLEIHYDAATPTRIDGEDSRSHKLALGQSVSVGAVLRSGAYYANEIRVFHEVLGPVAAVNPAENQLQILGQRVRLPAALLTGISVGSSVAVSGHRLPDGSIAALRVELRPPAAAIGLLGPVTQVDGGEFRIGEQTVRVSGQTSLPRVGDEVMVRGQLQGTVLHAGQIERQPRLSFRLPVERIYLQGYVRRGEEGYLDLEGARIRMDDGQGTPSARPGERIEVQMRVGPDGGLFAEPWGKERPVPDKSPAPRSEARPDSERAPQRAAAGGDGILRTQELPTPGGPRLPGRPDFQRPDPPRPEIDLQRPGSMRPQRPELLRVEPARPLK